MNIRLSDHFTYGKLLRFVFPSILMMLFTSIYGVVDGLFVSNFVGKTAFASVNLILPFVMIISGIGFMIGTGGSALVAKTLGEGDRHKANRYFTMMVRLTLFTGLVLTVIGVVFIRPIAGLLGATDAMMDDCVSYGRIAMLSNAAFMLQYAFQCFFVTAEKPKLGLVVTVAAGVTNMALDALFIAGFGWGVEGAAFATGISECVGGILPLLYFARANTSLLRFTRTRMELRPMLKACGNGASELVTIVTESVVAIAYNLQLIMLAGENGVAAYGVLMYVDFIFVAIFLGYSIGSAPIVGYHYGAENHSELKNLLRKCMTLLVGMGIIMTALAQLFAVPIASVFVGYDETLFELTTHAFRIFSLSFLLVGVNIYASAFFTALNNGGVSATISFLRMLVFRLTAVMLLPVAFGIDGVWWANVVSESCALIVSLSFLSAKRRRYQY
jgi:putative MATE family efflux protein